MATHFPDFALSAPPALTDFAVGFLASGAPGCERKTTWASVATTLMSSGGFLTPSGNLAGLANVGAAQANLGLGALATLNSVNNANWSGTALAVANGGTGATTGSGALSNLGAAASGLIESSGLTLESGYLAGRSTAATGAIEKITVSTGLSLSGGVLTATGAGAPANAFYLISQANGTLTNGIVISDFQGSPDIDVASGSNDEFTQNTSSTPSGWTNVPSGTPDQINTNGNFSQLYMEADGGGGTNLSLRGIYKAMPTAPFTMTVKISDAGLSANHNRMGIFVGEATASGKFTLMFLATASTLYDITLQDATNRTTLGSSFGGVGVTYSGKPPVYFRIKVTSTTSMDYSFSYGGVIWTTLVSAHDPGLTAATVGLWVSGGDAGANAYGLFDWVRFT